MNSHGTGRADRLGSDNRRNYGRYNGDLNGSNVNSDCIKKTQYVKLRIRGKCKNKDSPVNIHQLIYLRCDYTQRNNNKNEFNKNEVNRNLLIKCTTIILTESLTESWN